MLRSGALLLVGLLLLSGCTGLNLPTAGDTTGPGQRAPDYLRPQPYTSILVELDFVDGSEPEASAVSLLRQRFESVTGKPVEVVRTGGVEGKGASHRYTIAEIRDLEEQHRSQHSAGSRAVLYVLYLDGGYVEDTNDAKTLGVTYRGSAIAMFKANLRFASKANALDLGKPTLEAVEKSVLVHELGHALGLVNKGTPMMTPREDRDHPGHSSNKDSVMYWAVETNFIGSILGQNPPTDFDANDRADLRAVRER